MKKLIHKLYTKLATFTLYTFGILIMFLMVTVPLTAAVGVVVLLLKWLGVM